MTADEIAHLAKQLRPVIKPRMCALAEHEGRAVGFVLGLPDYNQALRRLDGRLFPFGIVKLLWYRRSIDAARVLTLGLKPGYRNKGLDAILIQHVWRECVRAGHPKGECSWILEDNWEMRRGIERSGGRVYKTYRVFEKPLPD
jgi:GNAT superfamily N-acetyltransferase